MRNELARYLAASLVILKGKDIMVFHANKMPTAGSRRSTGRGIGKNKSAAGTGHVNVKRIGSMRIQAPQLTPRSVINPLIQAPLIGLLASLLMVGSLFGCAEEQPSLNDQATKLLSEGTGRVSTIPS